MRQEPVTSPAMWDASNPRCDHDAGVKIMTTTRKPSKFRLAISAAREEGYTTTKCVHPEGWAIMGRGEDLIAIRMRDGARRAVVGGVIQSR